MGGRLLEKYNDENDGHASKCRGAAAAACRANVKRVIVDMDTVAEGGVLRGVTGVLEEGAAEGR